MPKKTRPKTVEENIENVEQEPVQPIQEVQDVLKITISRLGNIKSLDVPFDAQIRIIWKNEKIFESEKFNVATGEDVDLNLEAVFQSSTDSELLQQQLLDNPFYVVLLSSPSSPSPASKKSKTAETRGASSKGKGKNSAVPVENVVGAASLDVLPILNGYEKLEKSLSLHSEKLLFGSEIVTWPNLPFVRVSVHPNLDLKLEEYKIPENFMCIALEGIYNLKCSSGSVVGGLALPVFEKNESHEQFLYDSVRWVDQPNEERMFKWANIAVEGCAANTKYKITEDTRNISNAMNFGEDELNNIGIAPRLEWNKLHRFWLSSHCQQYIEKQIARYQTLPIEFYINNEEMLLKLKNKSKESVDLPKQHLIAYPNLSSLMYPGVISTRVATQIYTFTKNNLIERAGDESKSIFESMQQTSLEKTPQTRTQSSSKKSKTQPASKSSNKTVEKEEPAAVLEEESIPLQTNNNQPVFLVVQITLNEPLTPKKTEDEFIFDLKNLIPERIEKPMHVKNAENALRDYSVAIKESYNFITKSYQDYVKKYPSTMSFDMFSKLLEDNGSLTKIKNHLRDSVMDYIIYKVGLPPKLDVENIFQNFLSTSYVKLVEDMSSIIANRDFDSSTCGQSVVCRYPSEVNPDTLNLFANEAIEENNFEKAKYFMLKMIDMDFNSPTPWIKMSGLMLQSKENEEAAAYAKEIISIDTRHPVGLLLYAIIFFLEENFSDSETFFHAVTTLHPTFVEAWIAFYFFYLHLQMLEEARVVLESIDKFPPEEDSSLESKNLSINNVENRKSYNSDNSVGVPIGGALDSNFSIYRVKLEESYTDHSYNGVGSNQQLTDKSESIIKPLKPLDVSAYYDNGVLEPILSWFPEIEDMDDVKFLKTAIFLLNIRCFMFAEMCSNKMLLLSKNDETRIIIEYILACCDYLQDRPENALIHLDTALRYNIQPVPLHLLAGHCYYKIGDFEKMEESYSFVQAEITALPIPFQLHLMYLRLGNAKFMQEKYNESKELYYMSCKVLRTPSAWLGMAKSCYMMEVFHDVETCLTEANLLDCENGEIWSYLGLVNYKLNRPNVFLDCYNQTKRFRCSNEVLREEIEKLYHGFYESNSFINRRSPELEFCSYEDDDDDDNSSQLA